VDDLYNFLLLWVPHLYGELEETDPKSRGYELVESDTELWEDEVGESGPAGKDERRASDEGELTELTRESWEVSNVTIMFIRTFQSSVLVRTFIFFMQEYSYFVFYFVLKGGL
jgi:hypothetical protein